MRITLFFLFFCILFSSADNSYSQEFTIKSKTASIKEVCKEIEKESDYVFIFSDNCEKLIDKKVNVEANSKDVTEVLNAVLSSTGLTYKILDKQIVVYKSTESAPSVAVEQPDINIIQQPAKKQITGKVVDAQGEAIIGANIIEAGTTNGTVTDVDGKFLLNVENDATIHITYIGYLKQNINTIGRTHFDITLIEDTQTLDELIVIAYGTQKKRELTGAISSINVDEMKDMPVMNLGQKMQGKFSGVQIYQINGEPGAGTSFRIRGQASINAGNAPLVVIDGFPSSVGIESISANEIESISILKDASATSLYGSRAANGVIIVTTKQAKSGQRNIQFTTNFGINSVPNWGKPNDLMNAREFAQYKKEFYEDKARYENYTGGIPEPYQNPEKYGEGTDWFDLLLRNALSQNYTLTLSSGINDLKSTVIMDYNKDEGVIMNSFSERFNARANNTYNLSEKIKVGLNLSAIYRKGHLAGGIGNGRNIIANAFLMDPGLKHQNDDGTYPIKLQSPGMFGVPNWYLVLRDRVNLSKSTNILGNVFGEYEIMDGLKYKINANVNISNYVNRQFEASTVRGNLGGPPPRPAWGRYYTNNNLVWLLGNTLNYTKSFNKHNLDILLGYDVQKSIHEDSNVNADKYPDDEIEWVNASSSRIGTAGTSSWSMLSYISRLNYNYNSKYLLSVALRRDGSSRFGSNAKWANFPSISAGWVVSDEGFMKGLSTISWLKFRTSYGITGNDNIGNYNHLANVSSVDYVFNDAVEPGRALSSIGNVNLTWERTKQFDLGFEAGFLKDRIYLFYDYYLKKTDGLLYAIDIPTQSGFGNIQANIGQFNFWGHEFTLESHILTGEFKWNLDLNISFEKNKAIKLGTNDTPIGGYGTYWDTNRTEVGRPIGQFWGYIFDGVYMTEEEFNTQPKHATSTLGSVRMKDVSGPDRVPDGRITVDDRTFIGDPNPDFYYGITNQFYYKNFDANIVLAGQYGGDILNYTMEWTDNLDGVFNVSREAVNRWRSLENPGKGIYPRTLNGSTELFRLANTRWVQDGSYLMAKNITLGYTLPVKIKNLKDMRFFLSIQNAFLITRYTGMNPEVSQHGLNGLRQGIDASFYPVPRTFSFGVNLNF